VFLGTAKFLAYPERNASSADLSALFHFSGQKLSASANQADHAQQHNCPRKSDKDAPDIEARRAFCAELIKQKTTDQRAGDPNNDVNEQSLLATRPHHLTGEPSRNRSDNQPSEKSHLIHDPYFLSLFTTSKLEHR
jgi:phage terminase Nu1 subunit (DNA packaging protein)